MHTAHEEHRPGDKARESGTYYCHICHSEGGTHEVHLDANGEFPQCPSCGDDSIWMAKPMLSTGLAQDPVCGMMVDPKRAAATSDYQGRTHYFCAPGCKTAFEKDPAKYTK
jgi:Cu+-exporting ATPase